MVQRYTLHETQEGNIYQPADKSEQSRTIKTEHVGQIKIHKI